MAQLLGTYHGSENGIISYIYRLSYSSREINFPFEGCLMGYYFDSEAKINRKFLLRAAKILCVTIREMGG
jgi:hypothetical protein